MPPLNNSRQEKFCLEYISGKSGQRAAIDAGYSPHSARVTASRLLTKANIISRIAELQNEAAGNKVMTVRQRKERLSEIAKTSKVPANPIHAIDVLNKMERIYADEGREPVEIVQSFVFILPDGTRVTPRQLIQPKPSQGKEENNKERR